MPRRTTHAAMAPATHVLVYDGGCPFCTAAAGWIARRAHTPLTLMRFDDLPGTGLLSSLSEDEVLSGAHLITPDGLEFHAGAAVTRALRMTRFGWLGRAFDLPGMVLVRDLGYTSVVRARPVLSKLVGRG